ncbi:hypothetical protein ACJX0J_016093, partial [Zea mays]
MQGLYNGQTFFFIFAIFISLSDFLELHAQVFFFLQNRLYNNGFVVYFSTSLFPTILRVGRINIPSYIQFRISCYIYQITGPTIVAWHLMGSSDMIMHNTNFIYKYLVQIIVDEYNICIFV